MRVLALADDEKNEYTAFEVIDVEYDYAEKGIRFCTKTKDLCYLLNTTIEDCNYICKKLVFDGFCDVTRFGAIYIE